MSDKPWYGYALGADAPFGDLAVGDLFTLTKDGDTYRKTADGQALRVDIQGEIEITDGTAVWFVRAVPADALRIEAVLTRNEVAHKMVSDLCHGRRDWIMSIPARGGYDPDLVIGASLRDIPVLMRRIEALEAVAAAAKQLMDMAIDPAIPEVLGEPLEALDALAKHNAGQ